MPHQLRPFVIALNAVDQLSNEEKLCLIDCVQLQLRENGTEIKPEKKTRKPRSSGMAAAVKESIEQQGAQKCGACDQRFDANIHHMKSTEGYHEFQPIR